MPGGFQVRGKIVVAEECDLIVFHKLGWGLDLGGAGHPSNPKGENCAVFHRFVNTKAAK